MGFMDKANKLAGQAQAKIDETLQQVNERLSGDSAEPAAPPAESATPPHGDPVAPPPAPEPAERQNEYEPPKLTGGDPLAG